MLVKRYFCVEFIQLIALFSLFVFFGVLGNDFYDKVVPFYDSMSYQENYLKIVDMARSNGYLVALRSALSINTTYSYQLLAALFSLWLPNSVWGLYLICYGLTIYALIMIFVFGRILSGSLITSLALSTSLIALPLTSFLIGGILDQRLDLFGGYLYMASVLVSMVFWRKPGQMKIGKLWIITSFLCLLHRPLSGLQLFLVNLVLLVINFPRIKKELLNSMLGLRYWIALPALILFAFLWKSRHYLYYYYFQWNIDIGKSSGLGDSLVFYLTTAEMFLGQAFLFLIAVSVGFMLFFKKPGYFFEWLLVLVMSFLPYVVGGASDNRFVLIPGLFVLLIPILYWPYKTKMWGTYVRLMLLGINLLLIANVSQLADSVANIDMHANGRQELDDLVELLHDNEINNKYVSGTVPVAASLGALMRREGFDTLNGLYYFHSTDFDLDKGYSGEDDFMKKKIEEKLREVCLKPGAFLSLSENYEDDPSAYLFSYSHTELINEIVNKIDCFVPTTYEIVYENRPVRLYVVK